MKPAWQGVALLIGVTGVAVLFRGILTLANFTTLYILLVLILAIRNGTRTALVGSVVSFLCINFFLVQPYATFLIADPRELIDLIIFFVVALVVGQLAARTRQQAQDADSRADEQKRLYNFTRTLNQLATAEGVYNTLTDTVQRDFGAARAFNIPTAAGLPSPASEATSLGLQPFPVQTDQHLYATLCADFVAPPTPDTLRILNTFAAQAGQALQRIDLTERARKSEQFEQADRLKTALLHAVSHDLRTPITIIKTSASNLSRLGDTLSTADRREAAHTIEQEADTLDGLVGNLLDMSRLRAGAMTLHSEPNSLEEVAGDATARSFQRTQQGRIRLDFPPDLPLVSFDYGLLLQVLINLIDNALRYEPAATQIILRGQMAGATEAQLCVINHGENIVADERQRIMEPFYHGKGGKIGLGLAIANGIVEAHQGQLRVEDTPGGGVTFIIALPTFSSSTTEANPK